MYRRYRFNEHFFASIDCESKAYWLGFIAADGCIEIHGKSSTLSIALASRDREHLCLLAAALESSHPIEDRLQVRGTPFAASRLRVHSPRLAIDLAPFGIVPRKSFSLPWPELPTELLRHYLRGYFDGDGSFKNPQRGDLSFSLIGTEGFLLACRDFLIGQCALSPVQLRQHALCPSMFELCYGGRRQVAKLYALMYDGATIYLPRKRQVVDSAPAPGVRHGRLQATCRKGHAYTAENTYIFRRTDGGVGRHCRECVRERDRHRGTSQRGRPETRTECPHGHPYDSENTLVITRPNGARNRMCKECLRARHRAWRTKKSD